jgi:hypothetical protein
MRYKLKRHECIMLSLLKSGVLVLNYLKSLQVISVLFFLTSGPSWGESALFETTLSAAPPVEANAASSVINVPKSIVTQYEVSKNGQPFARVKEQFKVSGGQYQINSVTKGLGVYALLGERKLSSVGDVHISGLQPSHFELHQGDNARKSLLADFDWAKKSLQMTVKGSLKTAALTPGAQDLASFPYQFMFMKPADFKQSISMPVTNGKKMEQYQYKVEGESSLDIAGKTYKTLHLTEIDPEKTAAEAKQFWLATEHHYIPVRIQMTEDGAKLEQVLTDLQVE